MQTKNDLQIVRKVVIKIIVRAIKSAEKASLDMGYTDYRDHINIATIHLNDAMLIETQLSILPRNASKIMSNAKDDLASNRQAKAIKKLYKLLKSMGIKKEF